MKPPSASTWSPSLRIDRTDRPDGTTVLRVEGDVDMGTSGEFRETVMGIIGEPAVTGLVVDLAELAFIDSNGVTVLVKACRIAGERGTSFSITNAQDTIRGVLEMLGVYEMLTGAHAA